jgi:hypothetical protein
MNFANEIANKIKPGSISYYADRKNPYDSKTLTSLSNGFDKYIKNEKNWSEIIKAIYSNNAEFKNSKYIVAPDKKKGYFTVINTKDKNATSFQVKIEIKNNTLIITNLNDKNKKTMFEFNDMVVSNNKTETPMNFKETIIKNLNSHQKFNSPKETAQYIYELIKDYL